MQRCYGCMKEYSKEYDVCPYCGYIVGTEPEIKSHLFPSTKLADRYILGKAIGHGGFGITYIAWDDKIQKAVAIKEYFPNAFSTRSAGETQVSCYNSKAEAFFKEGIKKMLDEAKRLSKFSKNENIVDIYDFFEENNTAYIVMEYLEGKDLKKHLKENGEKLSPEKAVEIILPVINALEDMHKDSLIHRDISPDNIFICDNGKVKLLDFGSARLAVEDSDKSLSVMVKRGYAPKEQYASRSKQGPWTDVYAVCATLYRMITGVLPVESTERDDEELKSFSDSGVTGYEELEKVVFKGLEVEYAARIQSVSELKDGLIKEVEIKQTKIKSILDKPEIKKKDKIKINFKAIIAAVMMVVAVVGVVFVFNFVLRKQNENLDNETTIAAKTDILTNKRQITCCRGTCTEKTINDIRIFLDDGVYLFNEKTKISAMIIDIVAESASFDGETVVFSETLETLSIYKTNLTDNQTEKVLETKDFKGGYTEILYFDDNYIYFMTFVDYYMTIRPYGVYVYDFKTKSHNLAIEFDEETLWPEYNSIDSYLFYSKYDETLQLRELVCYNFTDQTQTVISSDYDFLSVSDLYFEDGYVYYLSGPYTEEKSATNSYYKLAKTSLDGSSTEYIFDSIPAHDRVFLTSDKILYRSIGDKDYCDDLGNWTIGEGTSVNIKTKDRVSKIDGKYARNIFVQDGQYFCYDYSDNQYNLYKINNDGSLELFKSTGYAEFNTYDNYCIDFESGYDNVIVSENGVYVYGFTDDRTFQFYDFKTTTKTTDETLLNISGVFDYKTLVNKNNYYTNSYHGNMANDGLIGFDSEYLYYQNHDDNWYLYKTDGKNNVRLNTDNTWCINVQDEYVYYANVDDNSSIYRIKKDGSQRQKLNSDDCALLTICGEYIFYQNSSDGNKLYRLRTDGTDKTKLSNEAITSIASDNEYVFFCTKSSGLYRIKTTDNKSEFLCQDACSYLNVYDGWLYYANNKDSNKLYRIKTNGEQKEVFCDDSASYINVYEGKVYYQNISNNKFLYCVDITDSKKTQLNSEESRYINVAAGTVYYRVGSNTKKMYYLNNY